MTNRRAGLDAPLSALRMSKIALVKQQPLNQLKTSILVYGRDKVLLKTRCWILERGGYLTLSASDRGEIANIPPVTLVILCHLLEANDCDAATNGTKVRWPHIKTLVLTKHFLEPSFNAAGAPSLNLDGPTTLIETVRELVGNPDAAIFRYVYETPDAQKIFN